MAKTAKKKPKAKAPKGPKIKKGLLYKRHRAASLGKRPPVEGVEMILKPKGVFPNRDGRPSLYKPEIYIPILERISRGESLVRICAEVGMPDPSTIGNWRLKHEEFDVLYKKALAIRTHVWGEQVVEIADTPELTEKVITTSGGKNGDTQQVIVGDNVQARQLRIETRFKMMARHNRADYGDKVETGGKVEHEHTIKVIERVIVDPKPWVEHEG